MQLRGALRRLRPMRRVVLLVGLVFGLMAFPASRVAACSCAGFGTIEEVVAAADLAFIGTVLDATDVAAQPKDFGGLVRYAFDVERASAATDAIVHVHSLDDPGGAACGFSFGVGQRWFVSTHRVDGALHTGLCNGNAAVDEMGRDDVDLLSALLTAEPAAVPSEPAISIPTPLLIAAGAIGLVALASFVAFRRERVS